MSSYVCDDSSLKNKHSLATLLGIPVQMLVGANIKQTKLSKGDLSDFECEKVVGARQAGQTVPKKLLICWDFSQTIISRVYRKQF